MPPSTRLAPDPVAADATPKDSDRWRQILGVRFFAGPVAGAVRHGLRGGLVLAPAGPDLAALPTDPGYRDALTRADLVLTDSGLMVLLWWFLEGERLTRTSGLTYLKSLLAAPDLRRPANVFWVMPTPAARDLTFAWLRQRGHPVVPEDFYVAPQYRGDPRDPELVARLEARGRPAQVIIGVGGGIQEQLGLYLRDHCAYRPAIHCIGAAIGFLTGDQAPIPDWADRAFLGWLLRCFARPRRTLPRLWRGRKLIPLMVRYRTRLPVPHPTV